MAPPPSFQMAALSGARTPLSRSPRFTNRFSSPGNWGNRGRNAPIYVFDPKTLATRLLVRPSGGNVFEDTNSRLVSLFVWLKSASERWFSHLFLLIALILYALIGGAIFHAIEGGFEAEQNAKIRELHEPIVNLTESMVHDLWRIRIRYKLPPAEIPVNQPLPPAPPLDLRFRHYVGLHLDRWQQTVREQCEKRLNVSIESFAPTDEWNWMGSVFFSMTVFTTIGYGDKAPKTTAGKVGAMLYSFVGIPLFLIVLVDYGKIFTKMIKFVIIRIRRLYYDRTFRSVRRMGRKATQSAKIQEAIVDAFAKMQRPPPFYVDPVTGRVTMWPKKVEEMSAADLEAAANRKGFGSLRRVPPAMTPTPSARSISLGSGTSPPDTPMPAEVMLDFDDLDDEFNLPISLALTILLLYLLLGAIIFWSSESWSLFHAFYYVFISLTTIGFGDFVPRQVHVLMYAFIYLLFGLALTSMCINVVQEKLRSTFDRARLTIGETIGLDHTEPIMAPDDAGDDEAGKGDGDDKKDSSSSSGKDASLQQKQKQQPKSKDINIDNNNNNNTNTNNKTNIATKPVSSASQQKPTRPSNNR